MNFIKVIPRLTELAQKNLWRHKLRSILTLGGVAAGMFLYASVTSLQNSLKSATDKAASESSIVVFQANRFCPTTSRLPEHYLNSIKKMKGVKEAYPVQVVVNNCGASLDVVTFRGITRDYLDNKLKEHISVKEGSLNEWPDRGDAAIVPAALARKKGIRLGESFIAAGITAFAAAIIDTKRSEDAAVVWVSLPFLQQASGLGLGSVTQFEVESTHATELNGIIEEIDKTYSTDQVPTHSRPRSAFITDTAGQMLELVKFSGYLSIGAVIAVLGLLSNSALLAVRGRIKESAILQTIGWPRSAVFLLNLCEGAMLGVFGGIIGIGLCLLYFTLNPLSLGNEGVVLALQPDTAMVVNSLIVSLALGLVATAWPAWIASRRPLAESLR